MSSFKVYDTFALASRKLFVIVGDIEEGTLNNGDNFPFEGFTHVIKSIEFVCNTASTPKGQDVALCVEYKDNMDLALLKSWDWNGQTLIVRPPAKSINKPETKEDGKNN